jgi:transposase
MAGADDHLPDDTDALKAALIETRAKLVGAQALNEYLQLVIAKMQREKFGPRSERGQRLIDQLELQLEELAAAAGEDGAKADAAGVQVRGFTRRAVTRRNFPTDLFRLTRGAQRMVTNMQDPRNQRCKLKDDRPRS